MCAQPDVFPDAVSAWTWWGSYLSQEAFRTHFGSSDLLHLAGRGVFLASAVDVVLWNSLHSEVINTPWEPVFSCGFPVPSAISSRSQEPGPASLLFTLGWLSSVHVHTDMCVWERESWTVFMPWCFVMYSLPENGTWCSVRWRQKAKSPVAAER